MDKIKNEHFVSYADILDKQTLSLFENKTNQNISQFSITSENFAINIDYLIESCNLTIEEKALENNQSGYLDLENNEIVVNKNEPLHRKRFTKAHELAHYLHDHHGTNLRTNDLNMYTMEEDYENEKNANDTAANILMPKLQVEALCEFFKTENKIVDNSVLNSQQKEALYNFISMKLEVSKSAANYRLINLGLL
ncbi:ImmA/IrrE family metallo-endopeptidase [Staphylococcus epidermidis]|uniref:ImmA/IrrE family metallo-endopeptidase n=1 Tax=Staphylococcus epidermidis TaxID=1282 RepID=UPI00138AF5E3|nr:ImmA/IrrE family metallo-endopeptidase [Staphylococcus epidermidis]MBC2998616.1 ImmA/IrrE family metallo-endopeptidase [Staphylococcus epidermidis]MBC3052184.1 ImmA/IrrE family metallo-endopeptidase [Staphylococcus epidermidis]MBC3063467.1 ImmA/IrrE family metallo-endopeptidase [Staphylococcus epidermidis]